MAGRASVKPDVRHKARKVMSMSRVKERGVRLDLTRLTAKEEEEKGAR